MPGQTNALGTVFGGQIMAWVDVCAAVAAQRFTHSDVVTVSMDELSFRSGVRRGDIVVLQAMVNFCGRTSVEVGVRVEKEDPYSHERTHTSSAYLTFVAVDAEGRPKPVPSLTPESEDEKRRWREASQRRRHRLELRAEMQRARSSEEDDGSALWLASGSPRRRDLLTRAGLPVVVRPADIDERRHDGEDPVEYARRLAREKGERGPDDRVVVSADTVVHLDGDVLDKPVDRADARAHLRRLSGRWHTVTTGVSVRRGDQLFVESEDTRVRFRVLTEHEIEAYVASGEADDKAGAYGIQGLGGTLVATVEGCWTNVMGLPLERTLEMLARLGVTP